MDVGVLIPPDDPVRLLAFVLKQLDLNPLYEAYTAYCERRRREGAGREGTQSGGAGRREIDRSGREGYPAGQGGGEKEGRAAAL
jgi:hypothetical protein